MIGFVNWTYIDAFHKRLSLRDANLFYKGLIGLKVYGEIILFRYENRIPLFALQRGQKKI